MCGITGFLADPAPVDQWLVDATLVARHRGPDSTGFWISGMDAPQSVDRFVPGQTTAVGMGFLRLRILDLTPAGNGPMVAPGRATLCFNGEIYNYLELRRELEQLGVTFHSTGDTEVLLQGWLAWGFDLLPRLDGMWAFAIWDEARQGMLLCRDRFGEKPLFWTPWRGGVAFASEVKQLAKYPGVALRLAPGRAESFLLTGRPYDGASSWFEGIHQLDPGAWMWVDADGVQHGRYFDLEDSVAAVEPEPSRGAWAERFAAALHDSVRLRLRSDVPVGTSLSGGVDSSAVMAEVTGLGNAGYHSFTLRAGDPRIDESRRARAFANTMGSIWHGVGVTGDEFARSWDTMTWHHESPIASTSLFGQWNVMRTARETGVVVMLDGQGADEVLGGYHKFFAAHLLATLRSRPARAPMLGAQFLRQIGGPGALWRDGYRYLGRFAGSIDPTSWMRDVPSIPRAPSVTGGTLRMRIADVERWSLPNLLTFADRNSMAHSVEVRLPFLDPALAALALAMPNDVLIHDGFTKWPLRKALADLGGARPAWRRGKLWYGVPQAAWLGGPLREAVREWTESPHPAWGEIARLDRVRDFQSAWRARPGRPGWDDQVFSMVSLDRFLRVWLPA